MRFLRRREARPAPCAVCGRKLVLKSKRASICRDLAEDWNLSPEESDLFSKREGTHCRKCRTSVRLISFAGALLKCTNNLLGGNFESLDSALRSRRCRDLSIANISGCGSISGRLARSPVDLSYSEYLPGDPAIRHEDLTGLSYSDKSFDLVVNSDVIEHIFDYRKALEEIARVLKDEGYFAFTVPIIWGRRTKNRAKIEDGVVVHLESPSYHGEYHLKKDDYLVFWEFGDDFLCDLEEVFRHVEVYRREGDHQVMSTFICSNREDPNPDAGRR